MWIGKWGLLCERMHLAYCFIRQLISNLIIGFLLAPRGDRKRFEILTIIASVLQMTDEQKEQVGLLRPKNLRSSPSSNASSTPGWQSPQQQQQNQATGEVCYSCEPMSSVSHSIGILLVIHGCLDLIPVERI